jgi:hypothetical protein
MSGSYDRCANCDHDESLHEFDIVDQDSRIGPCTRSRCSCARFVPIEEVDDDELDIARRSAAGTPGETP